MDLGTPTITTEARVLIIMVQYYKDMWIRWSHILDPLTEADSSPKGRKILWNDALDIGKFFLLYALMILINIFIYLLVRIINLLYCSQGD